MVNKMTQELIKCEIAEYNEYRSQVAELVKTNSSIVFDYDSDKGEKDARSYVYKLRQSKSAIDKARKDLGESARKRIELINGEAKVLIATVESMIDVHMKPLDEKAARETERKAKIERDIKMIEGYGQLAESALPSERIKSAYDALSKIDVSVLQERESEGGTLQQSILQQLATALDLAIARELKEAETERLRIEQQEELERLRKEATDRATQEAAAQAERERNANEERLQREADERAKKAAEEAAQTKIREAQAAQIKAEEEAEKVKREAQAAEAKRIADEKAKYDADAKRAADIEHRKNVNNSILKNLVEHAGLTENKAKEVVKAIASGLISNVVVNY